MPLRELLAWFKLDVDDAAVKRAETGLQKLVTTARRAAGALASALAVGTVVHFTRQMIDAADATGKMAQQIGVGTDALQELRFAAEGAGASGDRLDMVLRRLNRRAGQARDGNRGLAQTFRGLGIDINDANGQALDADVLFGRVADRIQAASSQSERLRIAFQLMGSEGQALVPLLEQGAEGVEQARRRFRELGGGLSRDVIEQAAKANDALLEFHTALTSLRSLILSAILPGLTRLVSAGTRLAAGFARLARETYLVEGLLVTLGIVAAVVAAKMLVAFAPIIIKVLLAAAAVAVLFLIVEDLIALFSGGDSVIGRFLDSLFGAGAAQRVVESLKGAVDSIVQAFRWAAGSAEEWKEGLKALGILVAILLLPVILGFLAMVATTIVVVSALVTGIVLLVRALSAVVGWFGTAARAAGEFIDSLFGTSLVTVRGEAGPKGTGSGAQADDSPLAGIGRLRESIALAQAGRTERGQALTVPRQVSEQDLTQVNETTINVLSSDPAAAASAVERRQRQVHQSAARDLDGLVKGV